MSSYLTPYNIAIANQQKRFDVQNIRKDAYEASQTPLYGGQMQRDDFELEGGDFWSDFADGFMSVMKPIGQVAQVVAPFLGAGQSGGMACRCPRRGRCRCGAGLSGGDEVIDTEPSILTPNLNATGLYHDNSAPDALAGSGASGGSWALARLLAPELSIPYDLATGNNPLTGNAWGSGQSGGDFWSDLGSTFQTIAPFLPLLGLGKKSSSKEKRIAIAKQLLGSGFFDDLLDGFKKVGDVVGAVAPHVETGMKMYEKFGSKKGKGYSGGYRSNSLSGVQEKLLGEFSALHDAGLKGSGMSGGDFDWSSLLPLAPLLLGLGYSGGQEEPDMSYLAPFLSGFGMSGGNFIDDMMSGIEAAVGKVGDFLESGLNKVNEGFDKVMPLVEKVGKVADTAGKIMGAFSGKKGEGMSGGAMTYEQNMNMADAMGDIFSGMGRRGQSIGAGIGTPVSSGVGLGRRCGRAKDTRVLSGKQQLYKGGDMSVNAPYVGFDMSSGENFKRPVGGSQASVSNALLAERGSVNQPYKANSSTGGQKGHEFGDHLRSHVNQPYVGEGRCCFTSSMCNGSKAYRYKKGEKSANQMKVSVRPRGRGMSGGQAGNSEPMQEMELAAALTDARAKVNPMSNGPAYAASGASGGKRPASKWIEHVKAYSAKHGVSYKQALKDAKATYRGAGQSGGGQSGGDFWSDLGNVASSVAPFLPLLL
jgi:hypothetical protein